MKIALGPLLYYWPRETMAAFYREIAGTPVDIVYLGETVCSRRHNFRFADWLETARMLREAGKEVVLSSQVLIESESDLKTLRAIAANGEFMVEANEMGAVNLLAGEARFVAGAHLNIFNSHALQALSRLGAMRWVAPVETSAALLEPICASRPEGMQSEVFAFGRMPLAFSARCFTARAHNLPKDDCQFRCMEYPDGLTMNTREEESFLTLNGIQTQSWRTCNLLTELDSLRAFGVDVLRISPQSRATPEVIALFRDAVDGRMSVSVASRRLAELALSPACNGYWHEKPGMAQIAGAVTA